MPIGVTRRGNLFGVDVAVAAGKQLFLFHTEIADIYQFRSHFYYLAFCTKEILGSTSVMRRSPRMMATTDSSA